MNDLLESMKGEVEGSLLRYAVQRAMFCSCGSVLDVRSAVMIDIPEVPPDDPKDTLPGIQPYQGHKAYVLVHCHECHERVVNKFRQRFPEMKVLDGKILFPEEPRHLRLKRGPSERNAVRADEVEIGATYEAKISGRFTRVRIVAERSHRIGYGSDATRRRGWDAVNEATNRPVYIKSASKLRRKV